MSGKTKLFCSIPRNVERHKKNKKDDFTCYKTAELVKIANQLNLQISPDMKKMEIWELINSTMKSCGGKEWCWAKKLDNDELIEKVFLPEGPYVGRSWLSNFDIDSVLGQYEIAFPDYKYAGCFSVEVSEAAKKEGFDDPLEISKLLGWLKKYKYVGGVFNLDCYTCPGTHWTNFMLVKTPAGVEFRYYDSVGNNNSDNKIPVQVMELAQNLGANLRINISGGRAMSKIKIVPAKKIANNSSVMYSDSQSGKKVSGGAQKKSRTMRGGVDFPGHIVKGANVTHIGGVKFLFNGNSHQRGDTECGVYSIHIQDLQINDMDFAKICQLHLPDDKINMFRQIYFRPK